jgi:uncharacterized protein (DUF1501 family)
MPNIISRRELLVRGGTTLGAAALASRFGLISAMAQTTGWGDYKAMVCIFLNGGNDSFNMIAPYEQSLYTPYYNARPTIALTQAQMLPIASSLGGSLTHGLHPNLGTVLNSYPSMHNLYNAGKIAVAANVGTLIRPIQTKAEYAANPSWRPKSLFDHGIQTDTWQYVGADEGWGNGIGKILTQYAVNPNPTIPVLVNVTGGASVYLTGGSPYITLPPGSQNGSLTVQGFSSANDPRLLALRELYKLNNSDPVVKAINDRTDKAITDGQVASNALATATINTVFPNTNLGRQLKQIATIIKARNDLGANKRQVFFASLGGFDTHDAQLTNHPALMQQLGEAMSAFYKSTQELQLENQVTTFTLSEFGRTVQNSGDGTDHAWGTNAFIMGGAVKGGRFYGTYPSLVLGGPDDIDTTNPRGRILPKTSVDQYAATLCKWFGLSLSDMRTFLPNIDKFSPQDLGFMS